MQKYLLPVAAVERQLISDEAYRLFVQGGRRHGNDKRHWAEATETVLAQLRRHRRISEVAYQLWIEDGCVDGRDKIHWRIATSRIDAQDEAARVGGALLGIALGCALVAALLLLDPWRLED